jgi:uncharacterized protein (TIGR03067 family)
MRTQLFAMTVVVLSLAADSPKDAAKKDQEKLQGDWVLASGERDGEQLPDDLIKSVKRTVTGDKSMVTRDGQAVATGTFTLDPSKKPKAIDFKLEGTDQPIHGIYDLDGDTFKLCYAAPGEERPKEFATKAGTGHTLAVWKKAKK